jgi:predicted DCC family thiol-disulfide oxidoreductase YuxK
VAIQSEEGESILEEHQKISEDSNSIILLDGDNVLQKSDVLIEIYKDIGGYHRFFSILLAVFPKFFRDYFYRLIASNRYRIFGKRNTCMKPPNFEE